MTVFILYIAWADTITITIAIFFILLNGIK